MSTLKSINKSLYKLARKIWEEHETNGGTLYYSQKEKEFLAEVLDHIEVRYLKKKPEGVNQTQIKNLFGPLTDEVRVFNELIKAIPSVTE